MKSQPPTAARSGAESKPRLALFDLDLTLLPIDSDYSWGQFTTRIGWRDAEHFAAANARYYEQYQTMTLDINEYTRFATGAFREAGREKAQAAYQQFMDEVIAPEIRPEALHLIEQHRAAGDRLLIVTATNEFVAGPIAQRLGVEEFLAVQLERDADGWYTGNIDGVPTSREGKVIRVQAWLAAQGLHWHDVDAVFYSDSTNDLPLLERVQQPVATNPSPALRRIAQERGWRILDLFEAQTA